MKKEVKIGSAVRDVLTGFEGTVIQRVERHNGNIMFSVQPKLAADALPGTYPDGMSIDMHTLEWVGAGIEDRVTPVTSDVTIQLGWEVKDIVTGLEGIAMNKITFLNGCVYFEVQPKIPATAKDKTVMPEMALFDHSRLKKVSTGIAKDLKLAPPAENGLRPGGPAFRMKRV